MHAVFAGLTTRDEIHLSAAGGSAANAAATFAVLSSLDEGATVSLLTSVGHSTSGRSLATELSGLGVQVLDAAWPGPADRTSVSTNAQVHSDSVRAIELLARDRAECGLPDVVLVDGHHPELADVALRLGTSSGSGDAAEDPFAELEDHPSHLRILDGGSWKPAFVPLLGYVDVAVISADFRPPLLEDASADAASATPVDVHNAVADFLAGFGIRKIVRTDGPIPVRWRWDGATGEVAVASPGEPEPDPEPEALAISGTLEAFPSSLGAGDIFHGAFAWAAATRHAAGLPVAKDPTALIDFASDVASLSTRTFGTRSWVAEDALVDLVHQERARVDAERPGARPTFLRENGSSMA